jgi:L-fucose isomerase-like protein
MNRLRIAHVALVRPAFKGDAPAAVGRSREGLRTLSERLNVELVAPEGGAARHPGRDAPLPPGTVTDEAEARAVAAALADDPPDLLLLQHVTFATGDLLAPLVRAAPRLAVWALPEGDVRTGPLPFNALCGLQMTLSLLDAPQVGHGDAPVKWLHGEVDDPRFVRPFEVTVAALRALRVLQDATVLRIGGTAPGFFALEERPAALRDVTVVEEELATLFARVEAVPEEEARARARRGREGHDVDVDDATLVRGARIEAALEGMAVDAGADALAVRCWPELPDRCDAMACAAMGTLAGGGRPAACEGDLMGALSMLTLQAVAEGPAILMDLSELDEAEDALLLWHCGNAPAAWADPAGPRPRLTTHFNRDGVGPVRDETLAPGPASALRLLDGGRSALVASGTLRGVEMAGYDGVRGWWSAPTWAGTPLPAGRFLAELLDQRVPHHLALAAGRHEAALAEACRWLGIEVRGVAARPFPDALDGGPLA